MGASGGIGATARGAFRLSETSHSGSIYVASLGTHETVGMRSADFVHPGRCIGRRGGFLSGDHAGPENPRVACRYFRSKEMGREELGK